MYKQTIRPVLFLMEPEKVHALLVSCLKCYRHLHGADAGYVTFILVPTNS